MDDPGRERGRTVGDVAHSALRDAELVGGAAGLDNEIASAGVFDPEHPSGARRGELVVCSAAALADPQAMLAALAAAGAAGVVATAAGDADRRALGAAANHAGLPTFALGARRFSDIIVPLLTEIAARQARQLSFEAQVYAALTDAAVDNEELGTICRVLSEALDAPVAIVDEHGVVSLAAWGPATGRQGPNALLDLERPELVRIPIVAGGRAQGTVVADLPSADARSLAALRHGATVAGIRIVAARHMAALDRRQRQDLVDDVLDGKLDGPEAERRARNARWPREGFGLAALTLVAGTPEGPLAIQPGLPDDLGAIAAVLRHVDALLFTGGRALLLVVPDADPERHRRTVETAVERIETLGIGGRGRAIKAGISLPHDSVADLPASLREALVALQHGPAAGVCALGEHPLLRLALAMPHATATSSVAASFAELPPALEPTLQALVASNFDLVRSSRELFVHYNTLRQRLRRLRERFGPVLDDPEGRAEIALELMRRAVARAERQVTAELRTAPGAPGATAAAPGETQ